VNILLVEDDLPTRTLLASALTAQHYRVEQAADGQTGLALAERRSYDLILLDVMLPNLDGITVCRRLRAVGQNSPILLLTAKHESSDRILGLDAGADDYVVKPFVLDEVLARVRALLRRERAIAPASIIWETIHLNPASSEVRCGDRPLHLTPKEYCLLELFLRNPKRIFSRQAILDRLWDFADSPGEATVSTHLKCLRQKLKAGGANDPIETVHGLGYRLRPSQSQQTPKRSAPAQGAEGSGSPGLPEVGSAAANPDYRQRIAANIAAIWARSKANFLAQVETLAEAIALLAQDQLSPAQQQQAQHDAHKLTGGLGIFGLMEGSRLARELEDALQPQARLEPAQALHLTEVVSRLRQVLIAKPIEEVPLAAQLSPRQTKPAAKLGYQPQLLIVDDDVDLAELVRREAIAWGLRVELATDLAVARGAIAQAPPDVVLLDLNLSHPNDGLELLQDLDQRLPRIPVLAFTARGSLADRLAVARSGGCVYLQKPLLPHDILTSVADVLHQSQMPHHNRVLVMDDDATVIDGLMHLLQPLGVEVTGLSNPQQFWDRLAAIAPNLLVLDLEMPDVNGVELCRTVRSDSHWQRLPILFLSAHATAPEVDRAFAAGADDYLSKTTPQSELVTRILHRLQLRRF
jgi:DNA-binding response OmpR family regulator